jgi:DNA polymerase-3 subunit epsilon
MAGLDGRLVVFDIESSGLDVETERIVSISACVTKTDGTRVTFNQLVNPGVLIPASASRVNNIYDETVCRAPSFEHVGQQFLNWVLKHAGASPVLCAYNGSNFDFQMLYYELRRHCAADDVPCFRKLQCVDPFLVAKELIPRDEVKNYRQTSVYEYLFGQQPEGQHSSMGDTDALDKIVKHELFAGELTAHVRTLKNLKRFIG